MQEAFDSIPISSLFSALLRRTWFAAFVMSEGSKTGNVAQCMYMVKGVHEMGEGWSTGLGQVTVLLIDFTRV